MIVPSDFLDAFDPDQNPNGKVIRICLGMGKDPHYVVRPCPLCGTAMQASRSSEKGRDFDAFECLTCGTAIRPAQQPPVEREPE